MQNHRLPIRSERVVATAIGDGFAKGHMTLGDRVNPRINDDGDGVFSRGHGILRRFGGCDPVAAPAGIGPSQDRISIHPIRMDSRGLK